MKRKKKKGRPELAGVDAEIAEYLGHVKLKHRAYGIDETCMWAVVLKIQKHYEEICRDMEVKCEAEKALLRSELEDMQRRNADLSHKFMWLVDRIREGSGVTSRN